MISKTVTSNMEQAGVNVCKKTQVGSGNSNNERKKKAFKYADN